jgi:hypothetical protein
MLGIVQFTSFLVQEVNTSLPPTENSFQEITPTKTPVTAWIRNSLDYSSQDSATSQDVIFIMIFSWLSAPDKSDSFQHLIAMVSQIIFMHFLSSMTFGSPSSKK